MHIYNYIYIILIFQKYSYQRIPYPPSPRTVSLASEAASEVASVRSEMTRSTRSRSSGSLRSVLWLRGWDGYHLRNCVAFWFSCFWSYKYECEVKLNTLMFLLTWFCFFSQAKRVKHVMWKSWNFIGTTKHCKERRRLYGTTPHAEYSRRFTNFPKSSNHATIGKHTSTMCVS
jgi:hypothetical protein